MKSTVKYLTDPSGKRIAIQMSIKDYNRIINKVEEWEVVKAFDKAQKRRTSFQLFREAMAEIKGKETQL